MRASCLLILTVVIVESSNECLDEGKDFNLFIAKHKLQLDRKSYKLIGFCINYYKIPIVIEL